MSLGIIYKGLSTSCRKFCDNLSWLWIERSKRKEA